MSQKQVPLFGQDAVVFLLFKIGKPALAPEIKAFAAKNYPGLITPQMTNKGLNGLKKWQIVGQDKALRWFIQDNKAARAMLSGKI